MRTKLKKGDKVISIGNTHNCREFGRLATVKRVRRRITTSGFRELVVLWDDGEGWMDRDGLPGWYIEENEIALVDKTDPGYEMDA